MFGVYLSGFVSFMTGVICLLRGLVLGCCVFLFVVLLNLNFHLLLLGSFKKNKKINALYLFIKSTSHLIILNTNKHHIGEMVRDFVYQNNHFAYNK